MEKLKLYNHPTEIQDKINELVENVSAVAPTVTIQSILNEGKRSAVIQGTLGTYLVLLFPNDATHTTLRFYQTIYGTSSKITGPVLNSTSLITAYNASIAETYDTSSEDISDVFSGFIDTLTGLGFTSVHVALPIDMYRTGKRRILSGVIELTNPTETPIIIPGYTGLATFPINDVSDFPNWVITDTCYLDEKVFSLVLRQFDRSLYNFESLSITPGTHIICLNFYYSI